MPSLPSRGIMRPHLSQPHSAFTNRWGTLLGVFVLADIVSSEMDPGRMLPNATCGCGSLVPGCLRSWRLVCRDASSKLAFSGRRARGVCSASENGAGVEYVEPDGFRIEKVASTRASMTAMKRLPWLMPV